MRLGRENFWDRIQKTRQGCWLWDGEVFRTGYGKLTRDSKTQSAHRYAWYLTHGDIPKGMCVLHKCDIKRCVRPSHLFLGTHTDNVRDMHKKKRNVVCWGERSGLAKFKEVDIFAIRELAAMGIPQRRIARNFNTNQSHISKIVRKVRWAHLGE